MFGHHFEVFSKIEELRRRGFAFGSAGARMCREVGGRVVTNVMVRDLNIAASDPRDRRRLKIVIDGSPQFGGIQVAVDTTLVFPFFCDGRQEDYFHASFG